MKHGWLAVFLAILFCGDLFAERVLSDQATATLWTVGPNQELYAAFGHSALRITDPVLGFDRIYNFGTFDFSTPNFYMKFTQGELDYFLTAGIAPELLEEYRNNQQLVIEQTLNLDAAEMDQLFLNLEKNLAPENAAYRYDFVRDNCTTRIRDAVEKITQVQWLRNSNKPTTIRKMVQPYVADRPSIQTGINLLFGSETDVVISDREAMFLPYDMMLAFDRAEITGGRKLVSQTKTLLPGDLQPAPAWNWLLALAVFLMVAGGLAWWKNWRWFHSVDIFIFSLCGLIGCLLLFFQLGTRHGVLHQNPNLFWAWPTHLAIWFFPKKFLKIYWGIFLVSLLFFAGFILSQDLMNRLVLLVLAVFLGCRALNQYFQAASRKP